MKMNNEDQILDIAFRKRVIDEIEGNENRKRKREALKRYEIYKDNVKKYVLEAMQNESTDKKIVEEIANRSANISFCRKIINKKAMVYKSGVVRTAGLEDETFIEKLVDITDFNTKMKKTNRYSELFKNATVEIMPYADPATNKYKYIIKVLPPYLYDVIEDEINPEVPRVYIKSYFSEEGASKYRTENMAGFREGGETINQKEGDGIDQIIADTPSDFGANNKLYIWWSNKYHFTTDHKGFIVEGKQEDDYANPIGVLPFYNFSKEQDGQFWAIGGDDIIEASVTLNILLTDLFYIAKYQGMGIGYLFGKGVPKNMKVGASSFISVDIDEGDPTPQIGFASSNPPIAAHLDMIERYVAFLLSTNNLEPGTVQGQMSAAGAASGIQEMVRKSENMDDITDQQEMYRDGEPVLFDILIKWHNLYYERGMLIDELQALGKIDEKLNIKPRFMEQQAFVTEQEKLDIIEKRKSLGLDSMIDSIIRDNPDLSREEAEERIKRILKEKLLETSKQMKEEIIEPEDEIEETGTEQIEEAE